MRASATISTVVLAVAVVCLAGNPSKDSAASGFVLEPNGSPLSNVLVTGLRHNAGGGYSPVNVRTDSVGHFQLDQVGPVLFFRADGFRSTTRVLDANGILSVTLEDGTVSNWHVPFCSEMQKGYKGIGFVLRVPVPKTAKIKYSVGDDTWEHSVYVKGDSAHAMNIWEGPGLNGRDPPLFSAFTSEDWILGAADFSERAWVAEGRVIGVEAVGRGTDGGRWRVIQVPSAMLYYQGASESTAIAFDKMLSSARWKQ